MSVKLASLEAEEMYLRRQYALELAMANGEPRPRASVLTSLLLENILLVSHSEYHAGNASSGRMLARPSPGYRLQ